jgi:hypothetical protein
MRVAVKERREPKVKKPNDARRMTGMDRETTLLPAEETTGWPLRIPRFITDFFTAPLPDPA